MDIKQRTVKIIKYVESVQENMKQKCVKAKFGYAQIATISLKSTMKI